MNKLCNSKYRKIKKHLRKEWKKRLDEIMCQKDYILKYGCNDNLKREFLELTLIYMEILKEYIKIDEQVSKSIKTKSIDRIADIKIKEKWLCDADKKMQYIENKTEEIAKGNFKEDTVNMAKISAMNNFLKIQ